MGQPSSDKAAAMRAAFLSDLKLRLTQIEEIAVALRDGSLSERDAKAALLAQMHDIKGCGAPYGVPEATDLARDCEQQLAPNRLESVGLADCLAGMIREFRRIGK